MTKRRECGEKEQLDETKAKARAQYFTQVRFARMRAYRCRFCQHWHVGNWRNSKRRKAR